MLALWFHIAFEETEVQRMLVTCPRYRRHKEIESSGDEPSGWQWTLPLFAKLFSFGSWKNCWMVFKIKDLLLTRFSSTEVLWGCELSGDWGRLGPSDEMHFILEQVLRARLNPTRYERKQFKGLKQRMKKKKKKTGGQVHAAAQAGRCSTTLGSRHLGSGIRKSRAW